MTDAVVPLFEGKQVRVHEEDGEPWFPVKDLAGAWGVDRNTPYNLIVRNGPLFSGMYRDCYVTSPTEGEVCLNERGLYLMIGRINTDRLKNPEAREAILRFQRWVPELIQRYRKKEIVQVAATGICPPFSETALSAELTQAKQIAELTGAPLRTLQAAALRKCGLKEYADALTPSLMHGEAGQWLNPTQIGNRCGHSAREVNNYLEWHRFQYRGPEGLWRLTDKGELHGEEYEVETTAKHIEIRIRWKPSILTASGLIREQSETLARV